MALEIKNTTTDPDVDMIMNYRRLRFLNRCNNFAKNLPEDVAQHSFYVTLLAMAIADEINFTAKDEDKVNVELVMRKALLHDTDESITSDVPHNVKNHTPEFKKEIEKIFGSMIEKSYEENSDVFKWYMRLSQTCKEDIEGHIVDVADMLELALYCYEEVMSGNTFMEGLLEKAIYLLKSRHSDIIKDHSKVVTNMIEVLEKRDKEYSKYMNIL